MVDLGSGPARLAGGDHDHQTSVQIRCRAFAPPAACRGKLDVEPMVDQRTIGW
jgi:hypothetical protein